MKCAINLYSIPIQNDFEMEKKSINYENDDRMRTDGGWRSHTKIKLSDRKSGRVEKHNY